MKRITQYASRNTPHAIRITPHAITGAFLARVALEWTGRPWPWPLVLALAVLGAGVGGLVGWRLRAPADWPLFLLAVYLLWPQRNATLALQLLALAGLTIFLTRVKLADSTYKFVNLTTFTLALILYVATAAPDVLPADSGEFQAIVPLLGVAHPPGYPLYTLTGRLFTLLIPLGTAAYRLNLLSAFLAAGTLTLLGAATRRWARQLGAPPGAALVGGLTASLTLGSATTFWAQAGVANVRMPTLFLAALGLYALARHAADKDETDRWLWLLALALSLGLGHHPSLAFLGLFFLFYLLLVDPRLAVEPRRWVGPALVALAGLLPLLYLPLRGAAEAPLAPSDLDTLGGFWRHVTAQGFEGDMFAYANAQDLPARLALLPTLFRFQFNPTLLAGALLGFLTLAWRDRRLLALLAGGLTLHTFVSITYRAPQTVEYLMPAYLPLATLAGLAVAQILQYATRNTQHVIRNTQYASRITYHASRITHHASRIAFLLAAVILLSATLNGLDHAPSFVPDRSARAAAESILDNAPPEALVLADWHWATPLWYLQWVEGQRPDVEVRYVYPVAGQEYGDTWYDRIEENIAAGPLLLTHAYDLPGYTLEPLGAGFWLHPRPHTTAPVDVTPLDAVFEENDGGVRLLGYSLSGPGIRRGQIVELTLAWQAVGTLTAPPSFSAQLLDADGRPRSQDDRYLGTAYQPGEIRFERLLLPVYPDVRPGDLQLVLGVYHADAEGFTAWQLPDGQTRLDLATLSVPADTSPPFSLHALSIPFSGGPTLVGIDYDRSVPDTLRLYLHWCGPAQGGEQVRVGQTATTLPPLPEGTYQTVLLDLPGDTLNRLHLTLIGVDGQAKTAAGPWGWPLDEVRLPAPDPAARFVPLGDQIALVGVAPGADETVAPGEQLTVRLTFVALKPLVNDYGVSVRLLDATGGLRARHDLQPALGAIPTLKWIRGSYVVDPHPLMVPPDLEGDRVRATLVVYERFRGSPLRPLDGRMGVEVPLEAWHVSGWGE